MEHFCDEITEMIAPVLYLSHYNRCRTAEHPSSDCYQRCLKARSILADMLSVMLCPGGWSHILFFIAAQIQRQSVERRERRLVKPINEEDVLI